MRFPTLMVCCLAACMLIGSASAETQIMIPESFLEDTADLPVMISGISAATGVSFDLSYDRDVVHIEGITASSEIPGSNVVARIDNDIGYAKVAIPNTDGISAVESAPLAIIRITRVGASGSTVAIQDPRWSDMQFVTNTFDVILNGSIKGMTPATTTVSSGSSGDSSSSGIPAATVTQESTVTPAATTLAPVSTTAQPAAPGDAGKTLPVAPPDTTVRSTQPPVTTVASPGFCTGMVLVSGLIGAALLLYHRS